MQRTAQASDGQPVAGVPETTATAASGDGASCGEAPVIPVPEILAGITGRAQADADNHAGSLGDLPAKARESVTALKSSYSLGDDYLKRNYLVALCERLKEKNVAADALTPAIAGLTQTLGLTAAAAAPAGEQTVAAAQPSASAVEPTAPAATPTAPAENAAPKAPTDIQPPATPAEAAAPAAATPPETQAQSTTDTKVEQAPAGVPADPAAAEQKPAAAPAETPAPAAQPAPAATAETPASPPAAAPSVAPAETPAPAAQPMPTVIAEAPATPPAPTPTAEPAASSPPAVAMETPAGGMPAPPAASSPAPQPSTDTAQAPVPSTPPATAPAPSPQPAATSQAPAQPQPTPAAMPETSKPAGAGWFSDIKPAYAVTAVLLGLLAAILTYFLARRTPDEPLMAGGGSPRSSGPIIGDLEQSSGPSRVPPSPPAPVEEDVPWKPRKPKPGESS